MLNWGLFPYDYKFGETFLQGIRAYGLTEWESFHVVTDTSEWKYLTPLVNIDIKESE